jgi:hypothetical protein
MPLILVVWALQLLCLPILPFILGPHSDPAVNNHLQDSSGPDLRVEGVISGLSSDSLELIGFNVSGVGGLGVTH